MTPIFSISRIVDEGFVFVRGPDNRVTGIVTTADLSQEFVDLARPFFLLGEIERRLRQAVDSHLSIDELNEAREPGDDRTVESTSELTLGELERLLQQPEIWDRVQWPVDRLQFLQVLGRAREIRNEVLHFSPDPAGPEDISYLRSLLRLLRYLDHVS
jgi:hypothetical protein